MLTSILSVWKALNASFSSNLEDKNLILATYLDPRFKTGFLENDYCDLPNDKAIVKWFTQDICAITEGKTDT